MVAKVKPKRVLLSLKNPPDSFTRLELRRALKKVAAARGRRRKPVSDGAK